MPPNPSIACKSCGRTIKGYPCKHCGADSRTDNRDAANKRGYDADWNDLAATYRREHPLCEDCEEWGIVKQGVIVHHVIPIGEGGPRLDQGNLRHLCRECHAAAHSVIRDGGRVESLGCDVENRRVGKRVRDEVFLTKNGENR